MLFAAACSSGGDDSSGTSLPDGVSPPPKGEDAIAFEVTETKVVSMAASPNPFPEDVWANAVNVLNAYLDRGLVLPLRTGKAPEALEPLFRPAALARALEADRGALFEDGTPVSGKVTKQRATAVLTLLTARDHANVAVNAIIDVALTVRSGDDAVTVLRSGELVLARDEGGWRIDSYDLRAQRDGVPA